MVWFRFLQVHDLDNFPLKVGQFVIDLFVDKRILLYIGPRTDLELFMLEKSPCQASRLASLY